MIDVQAMLDEEGPTAVQKLVDELRGKGSDDG